LRVENQDRAFDFPFSPFQFSIINSKRYVLGQGVAEEERLLGHEADRLAELFDRELADRNSVEEYGSIGCVH